MKRTTLAVAAFASLLAGDAAVADAHPAIARADELVRSQRYDAYRGERYRVKTDDPQIRTREVSAFLDAFDAFFTDALGPAASASPPDDPALAYLFWSHHTLDRAADGWFVCAFARERRTYARTLDAVLIHTESGLPEFADGLVHLAAHQQIARRVLPEDGPRPPWLVEGLATYFSATRVSEAGRFEFGRTGPKRIRLFDVARADPRARGRFHREANRALRARKEEDRVPLAGLLAIDSFSEFGDERRVARLATSWALVHFLMHGDDGRHRARFLDWIASLATAPDAPLTDALGIDLDALERGMLAHAREVRLR